MTAVTAPTEAASAPPLATVIRVFLLAYVIRAIYALTLFTWLAPTG